MTAPHHSPSTTGPSQPSGHVAATPRRTLHHSAPEGADRVLPLLRGALPAALVVGALAIAVSAVLGGGPAALGALFGVAVVVLFSGTGLLVLRLVRTAEPMLVMVVGLGSYLLRIVLFGVAIVFAGSIPGIDDALNRNATMIAVLLTVTAWLIGEIRAFNRLRIPIFDVPLPASPADSAPADAAGGSDSGGAR